MVAILPAASSSRRRRKGRVVLFLALLVYLLQISVVYSSDGSNGGPGVVIRHGRSRGRHSSERRQQQHPGVELVVDNGAHLNHPEDNRSTGATKTIIEENKHSAVVAEPTDNETRARPERKIIHLEAVAGEGLLPYHPHPVRFSHKKAIEAKYKILKLTEKGLTNLKWQQQETLQQLQLFHKKHVVGDDGEQTEGGAAASPTPPGSDVARRRIVATAWEDLIGGKQLSLTSGSVLDEHHKSWSRGTARSGISVEIVDEDKDRVAQQRFKENEPNKGPIAGTVAFQERHANVNEQNAVKSHETEATKLWVEAEGVDGGNHNSMLGDNGSVSHLHSYLFKAMPRKRHEPHKEIVTAIAGADVESQTTRDTFRPDRHVIEQKPAELSETAPAAAVVAKREPNKSISSGGDRSLSPAGDDDKIVNRAGDYDSSGSSRMPGTSEISKTATMVIGSERNMTKTRKGADNGNDAAPRQVVNNGRGGEVVANNEVNEEAQDPASVDGSPGRKQANKSSFNSDNSNLNEAKSNGNADKRIHRDGVMAATEHSGGGGEQRLGHDDDDKSRQHDAEPEDELTPATKIEETVAATEAEDVIMTTNRAPTMTTETMKTTTSWSVEKGSPEGSHREDNKSEAFADRKVLDGGGVTKEKVAAAAGLVNESVAVISDGSPVGVVGGGRTRSEGSEKIVNHRPATTNQGRNGTRATTDGHDFIAIDDYPDVHSVGRQEDDPLTSSFGDAANEEAEEDTMAGVDNEGGRMDGTEDTSSMNNIDLADERDEDDTMKWDDPSRGGSKQSGLRGGYDTLSRFLQTVEQQHLLGANCTAGTSLNLGEGVVDRYAQERFRIEAEIAVNRANMLTRIFKMTAPDVQVSEQLLHASVISMIEFDEDIFAAGNCFDWDRHPVQKGLFCPFAHRLSPPSEGIALVKNLADEYHYLDNGSEWFYIARKNAERIIERNEQHVKAYHIYSNSTSQEEDMILSVKYEDGRWSKPYYDCGGGNIWMLTYTVPFFGYDHENETYFYMGTSGIDVDLRRVDIDQCPHIIGITAPLNIFAGTDKCKQRTTECESIPGMGFRRGSYRCVCQRGFYFPNATVVGGQKYFNGSMLEEEYEKQMKGELSLYGNDMMFECLPCAEGCDSCKDASPCIAALNWPMRTSILVMACAIIGFLPPAALFTFKYQQVKVVRAASPALLRVIALGAFFIYCTTIVMYPPPSIYTCTARIWLREIGFSLTYGALMLKTWRISVIFRVRSAKAVKITDASLLKRLGILCGAVGAFLLIRTIVAPPVVIVGRTTDDLKAFLCKTDWWDHTFTSMEVLFLAWGVRLCIMVRKAPSEFNESRFISMAIYNEFLLTCFLNVSMLFLQSPANPDLLFIIFFCHTQLTVTLLLALIFGSKVYLVFRGGGKPDEVVGLGVKPSGAKFICRSQGRATFGNMSTATSSTAQLGHYIGTEGRLSEQEAMEEIRNLFLELQRIQERCPPRGLAVATIAAILDSCKQNGNCGLAGGISAHNNPMNNNNNSLALKAPASVLMLQAAPSTQTTTNLSVLKNNHRAGALPAAVVAEKQVPRVDKSTNTIIAADSDISGYSGSAGTREYLPNNQPTRPGCDGCGSNKQNHREGSMEQQQQPPPSSKQELDHNEQSISQLRKCLQNCPVVSSSSAASSAGDLLLAQHQPSHHLPHHLTRTGGGSGGGGGFPATSSSAYVDYEEYVHRMAEENINADTRSSDLDFANLQLECMCSSDSVISSPTESTYKCGTVMVVGKCCPSGGSNSNNSMQNTNSAKNGTTETLEEEVAAVVSYGGVGGQVAGLGGGLQSPTATAAACYRHHIGDDKSRNNGNCCQLGAKSKVVVGASGNSEGIGPSGMVGSLLLLQKQQSLNSTMGLATNKLECGKTLSCGDSSREGGEQLRRENNRLSTATATSSSFSSFGNSERDDDPRRIPHVNTSTETVGDEDCKPSPDRGALDPRTRRRKTPLSRKLNVSDDPGDSGERRITSTNLTRANDQQHDRQVCLQHDNFWKSESSQHVLETRPYDCSAKEREEEDDGRCSQSQLAEELSGVLAQCREGDDEAANDEDDKLERGKSKDLTEEQGHVEGEGNAVCCRRQTLPQVDVRGKVGPPPQVSSRGMRNVAVGNLDETEPEEKEGNGKNVSVPGNVVDLVGEGVAGGVMGKDGLLLQQSGGSSSGSGSKKKTNSSRNSPDAKLVLDLNDKSKYTKEVSV